MKNLLMLMAASVLAGQIPAAEAQGAPPSISASGQGDWEMICHLVTGGDQSDAILGPDRSSYSNPRLQRASCTYKSPSSAPLVITISGAGGCPFKGVNADACVLTTSKGRAGSFELKVKAAR